MISVNKRTVFILIFVPVWFLFGAVGIAVGELVYQDDFEAYDVENPSDFSVGGTPSGNWNASNTSADATRIYDSLNNFGGTRLWISNVDGTTITSGGIALTGDSDYRFSAALLSETYDGSRQLEATYDLKIGLDAGTATSIIGGPVTVITHGDNWQIDDSKEDHIFTHDFSTGSLNPGDKLFVLITRVGVYAGTGAWFGVDDVRVERLTTTYDSAYYIDSFTGDDTNTGISPQEAWATLNHINTQTFLPGDHLLFRTGTVYSGQFKPQGSGASGNPIVVDIYGNGPKPRIDGQGTVLEAVLLDNIEYYEVSNLEITNTGLTRVAGRTGLLISVNDFGVAHHIHLKNLYVHDVNGSNVKADGGGVGIHFDSIGANARFDDLLIENCHLVRTDRNGITGSSDYCYPWWRWNPSTNVVIRGNLLEDIGGDGIVTVGCDGALVEYNTLRGGRQRANDHAAGIWPWGCKNTVIQFNEVSGMRGTLDGQGFDSDYECSGTIIQYNYSHDNDGGFLLVCAPGDSDYACRNSIIRYNISQNDGSDSRIFHISGKTLNTQIYNNVIYSDLDNTLIQFANWNGGVPDNTQFYNNIFYIAGQVDYVWGTTSGTVFENNVFYGNHIGAPADPYGLTSDPLLLGAGTGGDGMDSLGGYPLQDNSPARNTGKAVSGNGGRDFWDNPLSNGVTDRGVHEFYYAGDFDFSGVVDTGDLAAFGEQWLQPSDIYDLTGDGLVRLEDFAAFAGMWFME